MSSTARLDLRLIEPGQMQKEISHNEAIERLDMIVQPIIQSSSLASPPSNPSTGDCYVVAAAATGDWTGRETQFAMMGSGGWTFLVPFEGLEVRDLAQDKVLRFDGSTWQEAVYRGPVEDTNGDIVVSTRQPVVAAPAGGSIQDVEARAAITDLIARLEAHGLIASN